ncbi:MAG: aminodeoxychorismate synthase component I [Zavarzinella sp.]
MNRLNRIQTNATDTLAWIFLSDCSDPWLTAQKLSDLPHLLFLDSADRHPQRGRHSYVTADPLTWWQHQAEDRTIDDTLEHFHQLLHHNQLERVPNLPPFQTGLAGLFSYDLNRTFEKIPAPRWNEFATPALAVGWYDWVLAWDHQNSENSDGCWLICSTLPGFRREISAAKRIQQVQAWLQRPCQPVKQPTFTKLLSEKDLAPTFPLELWGNVRSNFTPQAFREIIQQGIEYTHAGDCFQVNLAQRLLVPSAGPWQEIYGRLRQVNQAPFAGAFDLGHSQILSASPERFLAVNDRTIETRPIKGTRPVGGTSAENEKIVKELLASPKDRAENVMIVDLLRNDLGRVAAYGSIHVPEICQLETYRYVHHLVSQVRATLAPEKSLIDLLRATLPGGSVTGAPKVRAMEIIAELEPTARGAYCGSLGFLSANGAMDTNILIRTFTYQAGWLQFPVGGGIVADSSPELEYQETLHKALGLLKVFVP